MPPNPPRLSNGHSPTLSEDTVRQLVEQQRREVELRSQELGLRKQEMDYQSKHASDILGAQERDRENERQHSRVTARDKLIFSSVIVMLIVLFAAWGLRMNKDAIVKDVLQIALGAVGGAFGGYGYASRRKSRQDRDDDPS